MSSDYLCPVCGRIHNRNCTACPTAPIWTVLPGESTALPPITIASPNLDSADIPLMMRASGYWEGLAAGRAESAAALARAEQAEAEVARLTGELAEAHGAIRNGFCRKGMKLETAIMWLRNIPDPDDPETKRLIMAAMADSELQAEVARLTAEFAAEHQGDLRRREVGQ